MTASESSGPVFGFFTHVEFGEGGFVGGYLLLNAAGRPMEFHCTSPIRPNRAQEILYGSTLLPYLLGDQCGQTLYEAAKLRPCLIFINSPHGAALREFTDCPVAIVLDEQASVEEVATASGETTSFRQFELDGHPVAVQMEYKDDEALSRSLWRPTVRLDLTEPFVRIIEAINEARRAA